MPSFLVAVTMLRGRATRPSLHMTRRGNAVEDKAVAADEADESVDCPRHRLFQGQQWTDRSKRGWRVKEREDMQLTEPAFQLFRLSRGIF